MAFTLFHFDVLSVIMCGLIGVLGLCVAAFSWRYLKGDRHFTQFFILLGTMVAALLVIVSADHIFLFLSAWAMANLLLIAMMIHKTNWSAARHSGWLALKHFALGFAAMAAGITLLSLQSGETSIQALLETNYTPSILITACLLLIVGAMVQCGLWPFHRWLISSMNSPTPTSAIMHAGLVNGGGFLLARFSPLFMQATELLTLLFILGLATALIGTLWKLMQHDIKRMLACSTMGQMGFMIAQCGMGLFPAAIAHLCWHGCFKAYLFLASGAGAQEWRLPLEHPPKIRVFLLAFLCGALGTAAFTWSSHMKLMAGDTTLFLIGLSLIAGTQLALPILRNLGWKSIATAAFATTLIGAAYGLSIEAFKYMLAPMDLFAPQELNTAHIMGYGILLLAWLSMTFSCRSKLASSPPRWMVRGYVAMLNAAQPHPRTITTHRNNYNF